MQCLVFVKFLPGRSLPSEFFSRINARWSWVENDDSPENKEACPERTPQSQLSTSAICITDYDSIEQLALDIAITPGAGIANIEVIPIPEGDEVQHALESIQSRGTT